MTTRSRLLVFCIFLAGIVVGAILSWTPSERRFDGRRVVVFSGGSEDHPFSAVVRRGASAAAHDLGCDVQFIDSNWKPSEMTAQFLGAIEKGPDSICVLGHPGVAQLGPLVEQALRLGIHVTLLNVDVPELRERHATDGLGFVGSRQSLAGRTLALACIRRFGLAVDHEVLVFAWGLTDPTLTGERRERARGCVAAFREAGVLVRIAEIPRRWEEGDRTATAAISDFLRASLRRHSKAMVVIADNSWVAPALGPILVEEEFSEIRVAAFDLTPGHLAAMRAGYLEIVHDQQPYIQGYVAVLQAYLSVELRMSGLQVETGLGVVDRESIDRVAPLVNARLR